MSRLKLWKNFYQLSDWRQEKCTQQWRTALIIPAFPLFTRNQTASGFPSVWWHPWCLLYSLVDTQWGLVVQNISTLNHLQRSWMWLDGEADLTCCSRRTLYSCLSNGSSQLGPRWVTLPLWSSVTYTFTSWYVNWLFAVRYEGRNPTLSCWDTHTHTPKTARTSHRQEMHTLRTFLLFLAVWFWNMSRELTHPAVPRSGCSHLCDVSAAAGGPTDGYCLHTGTLKLLAPHWEMDGTSCWNVFSIHRFKPVIPHFYLMYQDVCFMQSAVLFP